MPWNGCPNLRLPPSRIFSDRHHRPRQGRLLARAGSSRPRGRGNGPGPLFHRVTCFHRVTGSGRGCPAIVTGGLPVLRPPSWGCGPPRKRSRVALIPPERRLRGILGVERMLICRGESGHPRPSGCSTGRRPRSLFSLFRSTHTDGEAVARRSGRGGPLPRSVPACVVRVRAPTRGIPRVGSGRQPARRSHMTPMATGRLAEARQSFATRRPYQISQVQPLIPSYPGRTPRQTNGQGSASPHASHERRSRGALCGWCARGRPRHAGRGKCRRA